MKRVVFVYWDPHEAHLEWAKSVTNEYYPFLPNRLDYTKFNTPFLHYSLSALHSIKIPKADVYLIEGMGCVLPVLLRKKQNSKIIMVNDDPFFYDYQFVSPIIKKLYSKLLKKIDGIISTSDYMDSLINNTKDIPRAVVPLFANVKRFTKINANLNSNDICFVSNQNYKKGTDILINAFSKIKDDLNNKLYLVGPFEEEFNGLNNNDIITPGLAKKPEDYIRKCGIYVNPARHEPFGINVLEAMCTGIAPIVTNHCGTSEIVRKISKRLIVNPNSDEIIKVILWLDVKKRKKFTKLARILASVYTQKKSINEFKKAFYELIK